jgi:hypothetical protein
MVRAFRIVWLEGECLYACTMIKLARKMVVLAPADMDRLNPFDECKKIKKILVNGQVCQLGLDLPTLYLPCFTSEIVRLNWDVQLLVRLLRFLWFELSLRLNWCAKKELVFETRFLQNFLSNTFISKFDPIKISPEGRKKHTLEGNLFQSFKSWFKTTTFINSF